MKKVTNTYRERVIKDITRGKDVLDIGSIAGDNRKLELWNEIKQSAKSVQGIDIQESSHEDIVCGNMETYDFKREFDVIIAGDVIEHVSNQGLFLDNLYKHLRSSGKLILTTPNAKWPTIVYRPCVEHTLWHDQYTFNRILSMHNFIIDDLVFYSGNDRNLNFPLNIIYAKRAMLAICKKDKVNVDD